MTIRLVHLDVKTEKAHRIPCPIVVEVGATFIGLPPHKNVVLDLFDIETGQPVPIAAGTSTIHGRILLETKSRGELRDRLIQQHDYLGLRLTSNNKVVYAQLNCFTGWRKTIWYATGGWLRSQLKNGIYMTELDANAAYR